MYDFFIEHIYCGKTTTITGYNFTDACKRANINPNCWTVLFQDYID